ncbi:hypothetical protein KK083_08390 [Fulvivirgaceae bacterium PWU4]|uniref:Lipoprotein n=1 Tax=Chryseosolibacter histidini TaxID=2782349 RepID=A0AAP2DKK5_9BACT|nr:hypothetical protein [Chryseosolibacter histidini]MBT1696887.1 hypothetical protein [Chryseosolibacter histidini]
MKVRLLIWCSFILLAACSSGKKAYERGDYFGAVTKAITRLRQNPDHSKTVETLRSAYPLAVDFYETQAKNEIASNSPFKWKNAIQSYSQINYMYEQIRQCPGCLKVISNPKNYYAEIGPLKEKAADESYNAGITALMKGTRADAKQAYFNFKDAQAFVPGYKDVVEYLDKSKFEATVKVILEQIPVPARYNLSGGFFQDKVEEYLHTSYPDEGFVKFYTPQEASKANLPQADQIMRIQFDDFSVGNVNMKEKEETVSKDSVKVGEAKVEGKTVPVYNTVKAKLTTYRKEVISTGLLSMLIVDAKSNGVLQHKKFNGEYSWVNSWARYNGDERALTDQQLNLCKQKEMQPPVNQDLFLEFTRPIYNQLVPAIKGFYQNY